MEKESEKIQALVTGFLFKCHLYYKRKKKKYIYIYIYIQTITFFGCLIILGVSIPRAGTSAIAE
jgi:hypothetical protein